MEVTEAQSKILKRLDDYFYSISKNPTIKIENCDEDFLKIYIKFNHGKYFAPCELDHYISIDEIELAMDVSLCEYILSNHVRMIISKIDNFIFATNAIDRAGL